MAVDLLVLVEDTASHNTHAPLLTIFLCLLLKTTAPVWTPIWNACKPYTCLSTCYLAL